VTSEIFSIGSNVYNHCLEKHLQYIHLQRSGHPTEGWAPGHHLDDGIRQDNGLHQDVTGGWYDANDLRKPAKGNALLLYALTEMAESSLAGLHAEEIKDEIKWGNKFLLAMQEPSGYLLHYIGFTWEGYRENRWTDNRIGTKDDRTIITRPTDLNTHLVFISAESRVARLFQHSESSYAATCADAALRAYRWVKSQKNIENAEDLGVAITAASEMFRYFQEESFRIDAENYVRQLLELQKKNNDIISGYFFDMNESGTRECGLAIMGLSDFVGAFPDNHLAADVRAAVRACADNYYLKVANTSAFRIIPWLISKDSLESNKRIGNYWYKHFLHVGVNQHLARNGAGLVSAAALLREPLYAVLAQQQLDWIYGANPFNASTVSGIGSNQPAVFKTTAGEFKPHTPELMGGVMTGIGSNHPKDAIALYPGWWWTTEYWSPPVTYTIVLVSKLNDYYKHK
jgi:hypothetical protein